VADVIIASGQAFLVERAVASDATLSFLESHKSATTTTGNNFYRTQNVIADKLKVQFSNVSTDESTSIFINYINDPATSLTDVTNFDSYSFNTGNSFYLVSQKAGKNLSIQTRPAFNNSDTISLTIKGDAGLYKLSFSDFDQFVSASAIILVDNYLGIQTSIRSQSEYSFSITANAATQGANRFKIIFKPATVLAISGIELTGLQKATAVELNWVVLAEKDMSSYTVERSADGRNFTFVGKVSAANNNNATAVYSFTDNNALEGDSYYRIKAEGKSGEHYFSKTIKMQQGRSVAVHIYPNPVKDYLNVVLSPASGSYSVKIINSLGQQVITLNNVQPSAGVIKIRTAALTKGIYNVQIANINGLLTTERFIKD